MVVRTGDRLNVSGKASESLGLFIEEEDLDLGVLSVTFSKGGALVMVNGLIGLEDRLEDSEFTCKDLIFVRGNRWRFTDRVFTTRQFELDDSEEARRAMRWISAMQLEVLCSSTPRDLERYTQRYSGEVIVPMGPSKSGGTMVCIPTQEELEHAIVRSELDDADPQSSESPPMQYSRWHRGCAV